MDRLRVPSPNCRSLSLKRRLAAFTLVEMLVATVILIIIIGVLLNMTQQTSKVWRSTAGKVEVFRSARTAFDAMTRTISQATLNTYYDYAYVSGNQVTFIPLGAPAPAPTPTTYGRNSDLQFVSGLTNAGTRNTGITLLPGIDPYTAVTHSIFFQAPLGYNTASGNTGLDGLVNTCGFYVAYGPDPARPGFLPATTAATTHYRYRLMQFFQSSNNLAIYVLNSSGQPLNKGTSNWYLPFIQKDAALTTPISDFVLAENVVALIILPKLSVKDEVDVETKYPSVTDPLGTALAPNYAYDSSTTGQGGSPNSSGITQYPLLNSQNQLPPVIQVTMVAIDEASALKLRNPSVPPNATVGLTSTIFTQSKNLTADLTSFEGALIAAHLNFRVFQTDVAIRGSKWTGQN